MRALLLGAALCSACAVTIPDGARFSCQTDEDCGGGGAHCRAGICEGGAGSPEQSCADGADNDSDGKVDCADGDCLNRGCRVGSTSFTCDSGGKCACHPAVPAAAESGALCADGEDNDCSGAMDCADPGCASAANCLKVEACGDRVDNDGDGLVDCADPDCPLGTACKRPQGNGNAPGNCQADLTCG